MGVPRPFLGLVMQQGSLLTEPAKLRTVVEWPAQSPWCNISCGLPTSFITSSGITTGWCLLTRLTPLCLFNGPRKQSQPSLGSRHCVRPNLILSHQFTVEVDAADIGVRVAFSQRRQLNQYFHYCTSLTRQMFFTKRNYDL